VILAIDPSPAIASHKLQNNLDAIQHWLSLWRLKANRSKSTHVTFTNRRETCPVLYINNEPLPEAEDVKYLGIHLDKRLTWHKHISTKQKHLGITLTKLYWLLGRKFKLNLSNKLLIYKVAIKPIWTYGIQLWGAASTSNIEILEHFQLKALRLITDAPWYVPNAIIRRDLQVPSVKEEMCVLLFLSRRVVYLCCWWSFCVFRRHLTHATGCKHTRLRSIKMSQHTVL
jgi:hypothetical protein